MDWNLAIEKNAHALAQIVAGLWRLVGVEPKSVEDYEPSISSTVLATSSSSELATSSSSEPTTSSSSDLIRGSKAEPVAILSASAIGRPECSCVDGRIKSDHDGMGFPPSVAVEANEAWVDPRDKPEDDEFDRPKDDGVGFHPSVAGQGIATSNSASPRTDGDTEVSAEKLIRRLAALDHAIKTLPQQAKRLARIMAQREHAPAGAYSSPAAGNPLRGSLPSHPIRPGIPPGSNKSSNEPSHEVLRELHGLVRDWEKDAWERRCGKLEVP